MKIEVFSNKGYLGEYEANDFFNNCSVLSVGELISVNDKKYCIGSVTFTQEKRLILEVS